MSVRQLKKGARSALRQVMHRIQIRQKKDYQLLKERAKEQEEPEHIDSDAIYREALARVRRSNKRMGFYKRDLNAVQRHLQRHHAHE
eukprot:319746-Karenia_brevis.AAC.1